ncbi:MAG: twin-arginine translocase TatA/TatE family subunit [Oligoflexia bacterium]|nr:twin-arginine translocase TatA/TatE family subunit [Oligoflexia bacterium]MBF0366899.1 twin-arginine translocase TatA/TatE family subunit [Oligoflexia bacterium]
MFGIGSTELLIVFGIVIVLFGSKKLPELAQGMGKSIRLFKTELQNNHQNNHNDQKDDSTLKS